ncbi:LLM class flavin-dependent oxidoreductase [Streptomyces longispororuber]|uniref:LLM class flavin-dependent oxidoreductase n=1 Tax=Streptomyces longispororuber TaxID=68230 RepID=UPI002108B1E0|nr:LLM class flavin-dependent oxidoreductase [Streptomyces longispororuber]MCQ4210705.1 LLM class flavin-dependent oxidoreductase [Streptomyces longispororuber]
MPQNPFLLGLALTGDPSLGPDDFVRLVRRAEAARIAFVSVEDGPGRLDSTVLLTLAARETTRVGLVPLGPVLGQPAGYAARYATLDLVSGGRAGVRPRIAADDVEHDRILKVLGTPEGDELVAGLFERAAEFTGRVTRAWDSSGAAPQGRPPLISLAHDTVPYRFAARRADVVLVTPFDVPGLRRIRSEVTALAAEEGRSLKVLAELNVLLAPTDTEAAERRAALGEFESDAALFTGTPEGLADRLEEWHREGGADGFRIRPVAVPQDVYALLDRAVPELVRRGLLPDAYTTRTLRGHLGLTEVAA